MYNRIPDKQNEQNKQIEQNKQNKQNKQNEQNKPPLYHKRFETKQNKTIGGNVT